MSINKITYIEYSPKKEISHLVSKFYYLKKECQQSKTHQEFVFPNLHGKIILHFKTHPNPVNKSVTKHNGLYIWGPSPTAHKIQITCGFEYFGMILKPYALKFLSNSNVSSFSNRRTPLEDIFSNPIMDDINNNLCFEKINFLKTYLEITLEKLQTNSKMCNPIKYFPQSGTEAVKNLADKNNMSIRTFQRKFIENFYLPCKTYSRILRFQSLLKLKLNNPLIPYSELIFEVGYYSQPHFVREFLKITGISPSQFFDSEAWFGEIKEYASIRLF